MPIPSKNIRAERIIGTLDASEFNISGNLLISGNTQINGGLTANTISATTYQNLPISALTEGSNISITGSNGNYTISVTGTTQGSGGEYLPLSGGTVTGSTIFTNGLSANTISATTYFNLPSSTFTGGTVTGPTNFTNGLTANTISATTYQNLPVSGLTGGSNISVTGSNGNYTISVTGITSGGDYLPLSGGTVTGGTVFQSGVTANTISQTSYIDFTTGSTNPSSFAGRLFFDSGEKALSYYDVINSPVPIAMGQQLYTRVWNDTGVQIDKGKVIMITGTSNNLPSAVLATNNHSLGSPRPIGVAAENIPSGSEGLVINNGILSGITINTFLNGDTLYLSDTVPGEYVSSTSSLAFSARTNEIGYVIQTGTTTGKIYVNINNEDSNLTLTDIERNILEGNVISTGTYEYTGMTLGTGQTINVAPMRGWIVQNTYSFATLPDVTNIYYTGATNIPVTNLTTDDSTYILVNSASTLVQQTTFPTPQERRENIFLGKVVHPNRTTILSLNQTVDFDVSPMAAIRDLWTPIKLINQGVVVSPSGVNMNINTSAGELWGNGINWTTNQLDPNSVSISGTSPTTFQYRTQFGVVTGGTITSGNTTTIEPGYYDLNGVVTAVGGGSNSSTNQRVYLFPTGLVRIQLGQQVYSTLAAAVAASQNETFVEYSNNRDNGILIGIISLEKNASVANGGLVNVTYSKFNNVSKFGELLGGTGGLSTTTLQQAYNNSATPEIVTELTLGALSVKNGAGTADNVTNVFEGVNSGGITTSFVRADGLISGSSLTTPGFTANTNGLTATTISATTYQNLPTDIRVTGVTYNDNTFTYTNNTGGTFNVLFNTVTGLTVNGNLTVTGNTSLRGLTATTISATTYQNLPVSADTFTTGFTYSNNTFTIARNQGLANLTATINTVTGLTVNGNLTVTGNTSLQNFTGRTGVISAATQNVLTVIGSGNSTTSPIFSIQGSSGELFSVSDSLTGSLFSVNDISGLPILEVFSDNTTLWGSYLAPSLNTTRRTSLTAGTNTIYSIPTSAYTGAFFEYTLISSGSTGARAGQIMSIWSGSTANFTETTTTDIGTTAGVTFNVGVSGNNAVLSSSATTAGWTLKTIIRSI